MNTDEVICTNENDKVNLIEDFNQGIDFWIAQLDRYTYDHLTMKPSADAWSLGQLYLHLVSDTDFYLSQVGHCFISPNRDDVPVQMAQAMLDQNDFPDQRLVGDPSNAAIPQPRDISSLHTQLQRIRIMANDLAGMVRTHMPKGKTRHPGFGYFTAEQWLQFAAMHLRHHKRQKRRLDAWITSCRPADQRNDR